MVEYIFRQNHFKRATTTFDSVKRRTVQITLGEDSEQRGV